MPERRTRVRIAVGLSGGTDSCVAAKLLLDQGHTVSGITLRLLSGNEKTDAALMQEAAAAAQSLGIPHYIYDFRKQFQSEVVGYFSRSYRSGQTPNPCYICNKYIKFGYFLEKALEEGYDAIATGHYARIFQSGSRFLLAQAADSKKDQSYFLALLNQHQLSRSLFPLANLTKPQVRAIAEQAQLAAAHKVDSQDICFVPNGDYASVVEQTVPEAFPAGNFIDINGTIIGTHRGLHHYTIGQRRGLALAYGYPLYVVKKSAADNTVCVGTEEYLQAAECTVHSVNWIVQKPLEPIRALVKTRYRQQPKPACIVPLDENSVRVVFDEPERAVACGQAAVFYRPLPLEPEFWQGTPVNGVVIGGGIIQNTAIPAF